MTFKKLNLRQYKLILFLYGFMFLRSTGIYLLDSKQKGLHFVERYKIRIFNFSPNVPNLH